MTATNKALACVFNTPSEDHKVARVLSGQDPDRVVSHLSLDVFDSDTQTKIRAAATALFNASHGLEAAQYNVNGREIDTLITNLLRHYPSLKRLKAAQYNVNGRVIDTLITYLLRHYPSLKRLKEDGLVVTRLEACAIEQVHCVNELLAWSSHLACNTNTSLQADPTKAQASSSNVTKHPIFLHQAALIEQLVQFNHKLDSRVSMMEAKLYNKAQAKAETTQERSEDTSNEPPTKRRRTSASTNPKNAWFSWYAQVPRIWDSIDSFTKHTRSTGKLVAAFMKLFLTNGFVHGEKSPQHRDAVLEIGDVAEKGLLSLLGEHKIKARGAQNVLKSIMRKLHKTGHLNTHIQRYR